MYKKILNNNIKAKNIEIRQKFKLYILINDLSFSDSLEVNRAKIDLFNKLYKKLNYTIWIEANNIDLTIRGYNFRLVINLLTKQVEQLIIT